MLKNYTVTIYIPDEESFDELQGTLLENTILSHAESWSYDGQTCVSVHPSETNLVNRMLKLYDKSWDVK